MSHSQGFTFTTFKATCTVLQLQNIEQNREAARTDTLPWMNDFVYVQLNLQTFEL